MAKKRPREKMPSEKKRQKILPVRLVCRNCGMPTIGRYCHACGQDLFAGTGRKLEELVNNFFGDIFAWDNKVWRTLIYLVAFPGRLTEEFYAGRIARYVYPSKLFWFMSIVFFALLMSGLKFDGNGAGNTAGTGRDSTVMATADTVSMRDASSPERVSINIGDMDLGDELNRQQFKSYFSSYSPYLVLLLVPFFVLLIYALFKRKGRYYSDYLIFALHFQSFVFLLLSVMLALRKIFPGMGGEKVFFLWIPVAYLGISLRAVFRPRMIPMICKILLIVLLYGIIMLVAVLIFVIIYNYLFMR